MCMQNHIYMYMYIRLSDTSQSQKIVMVKLMKPVSDIWMSYWGSLTHIWCVLGLSKANGYQSEVRGTWWGLWTMTKMDTNQILYMRVTDFWWCTWTFVRAVEGLVNTSQGCARLLWMMLIIVKRLWVLGETRIYRQHSGPYNIIIA